MKYILLFLLFFLCSKHGHTQNIDAAFALDETSICFIKGDKVVHYNIEQKKVIRTESLLGTFPELPFERVDAVWKTSEEKLFLFSENQVVSYNLKTRVLQSPSPIAIGEGGLGLPITNLDAAITWANGKSYLFGNNKFIRYDHASEQTEERFPKRIVEPLWPGMKFSQINAAFCLKGKTYFFSGHQFISFDNEIMHTDADVQKICDWPELCEALEMEPYEGIDFFEGTWKEALMKAKAENKVVFLDAYTSWCKPCKKMAAEIFPLASVGRVYNQKFICLKMDMEQGEGRNLRKVYAINTFPTLLFVRPSGEVIERRATSLGALDFIDLGKSVE